MNPYPGITATEFYLLCLLLCSSYLYEDSAGEREMSRNLSSLICLLKMKC